MDTEHNRLRAPHHPLRRLGQLAFWFFLVKGLAWLVAPVAVYFWL